MKRWKNGSANVGPGDGGRYEERAIRITIIKPFSHDGGAKLLPPHSNMAGSQECKSQGCTRQFTCTASLEAHSVSSTISLISGIKPKTES